MGHKSGTKTFRGNCSQSERGEKAFKEGGGMRSKHSCQMINGKMAIVKNCTAKIFQTHKAIQGWFIFGGKEEGTVGGALLSTFDSATICILSAEYM